MPIRKSPQLAADHCVMISLIAHWGVSKIIACPMAKMTIPAIMKYLLNPNLSTSNPIGNPKAATTTYVIVMFLPAVTCEKQNLT